VFGDPDLGLPEQGLQMAHAEGALAQQMKDAEPERIRKCAMKSVELHSGF
jgi:hypothetical protein